MTRRRSRETTRRSLVFHNAFYTTIRVLSFDGQFPNMLVNLWNNTRNQAQAWAFIYFQILYLYDMLFNVMLEYVNLGSRQAVEQNISSIWSAISKEAAVEGTYAMPITRDLSAGKRLTLQLWIYLVANNYNVPDFNVDSIPAGWTPPRVRVEADPIHGPVSLRLQKQLIGVAVVSEQFGMSAPTDSGL